MFGVIRTHCVANDMNCFYDGVPSLRCAAFGMTCAREDWKIGLAGREIPLCVRNRRRPANLA